MKSIDQLVAEHDLIERALRVLEHIVARIESGQSVPDRFCAWSAQFFQQFADQCHHAKEEDLLFPLLNQRGIPEHGGPIGCMLHEHELGRSCVVRMREASEATEFAGSAFAAAAREFIPLLRQHIDKENNVLYRMALNVLSEADDASLTDRFANAEQEKGFVGLEARYTTDVAHWETELKS